MLASTRELHSCCSWKFYNLIISLFKKLFPPLSVRSCEACTFAVLQFVKEVISLSSHHISSRLYLQVVISKSAIKASKYKAPTVVLRPLLKQAWQ